MAKRFTDTGKWDHSWFRKLSPKMKCVWAYLLDKCDGAGVWNLDLEAMSFNIGEEVTEFDLYAFAGKYQMLSSDKLFIPSFIEFQYGKLSEDCNPHKPVISRLRKLSLWEGYSKGFRSLEDKDKDKDQYKDQDKEKEKSEISKTDFAEIYAMYPKKVGRSKGHAKFKTQIKNLRDLEDLRAAIAAYRSDLKLKGTEAKFIKNFDTFMTAEVWRDWLDTETGTAESFGNKSANLDEMFPEARGVAS